MNHTGSHKHISNPSTVSEVYNEHLTNIMMIVFVIYIYIYIYIYTVYIIYHRPVLKHHTASSAVV